MKTPPSIYRQGDVLLVRDDSATHGTLKQFKPDGGRLMLAYGEATGRHHSIASSSGTLFVDDKNQATLLEVTEALADLEHQEHNTIKLPAGRYRVIHQREYHPQEIRRVID